MCGTNSIIWHTGKLCTVFIKPHFSGYKRLNGLENISAGQSLDTWTEGHGNSIHSMCTSKFPFSTIKTQVHKNYACYYLSLLPVSYAFAQRVNQATDHLPPSDRYLQPVGTCIQIHLHKQLAPPLPQPVKFPG